MREKPRFTDILRARFWGPEKLAMWRLSGALLPGAKKPGGPLSCREGRIRAAGSHLPSPAHPHFSSPPAAQGPHCKAGGQSSTGPGPLCPGQPAPGRRAQRQPAAWEAGRQQGSLCPGVPQAPRVPGPDACPLAPFEGQHGKNEAGHPRGSVQRLAPSLRPAAASADLRWGRTVVCVESRGIGGGTATGGGDGG